MAGDDLIDVADRLCVRWHDGHTDKAGKPYIEHPRRVSSYVAGDNAVARAAALLHDLLEDSGVGAEELAAEGIPVDVIETVELLTRRDCVSAEEYYQRIKSHPNALEVKLADLADNTDPSRLALLDTATQDKLRQKYLGAYAALGVDPSDGDRRRG
ncbi:HD domain-containing protein [Mycobacterium sp. M26]|uniref:HD domain-containing protein n=1 Tax=Mycobacterium sp. M26 TaxID=1762962 RepID=UPI00073E3B8B|nr:HD domain-containing protein [Mycobacterium sp. M26]